MSSSSPEKPNEKEDEISYSRVDDRMEKLHRGMMDPSIIPRYLEIARQERQSATDEKPEANNMFSFSLSSYPWKLQTISARDAVDDEGNEDGENSEHLVSNHTNNFFVDPEIDYLELRRRQNQQWADQQYQTGREAQAAGEFHTAKQAFVAGLEFGLELVPNHRALEDALQDLLLAGRSKPPPSGGILRRSGLADRSERSRQDALLEKSFLLSSNRQQGESFEASKYPLLSNGNDDDTSAHSSSEDTERRRRRKRRRKRKKREKRRRRKRKREHIRRRRTRRHEVSSDDDNDSSSDSEQVRYDDGSTTTSDTRNDHRRYKRRKRRRRDMQSAGNAKPEEDNQTAGDRAQEKKSPASKEDSSSRRRRRWRDEKRCRKHRRRKARRRLDDSASSSLNDDASGPSIGTVDSLELIRIPHVHGRRERKRAEKQE